MSLINDGLAFVGFTAEGGGVEHRNIDVNAQKSKRLYPHLGKGVTEMLLKADTFGWEREGVKFSGILY